MEEWKFLPPLGLELRPLGHPARNKSLYRLFHPGSWEKIPGAWNRIEQQWDASDCPSELWHGSLIVTSSLEGFSSILNILPVFICHSGIQSHVTWLDRRFGLIIEHIEHLQLLATNNYNTVTNEHTLQITITYASFSVCYSLHRLLLDCGSQRWVFLYFCAHIVTGWWLSHSSQLSAATNTLVLLVLVMQPRNRPNGKHHFQELKWAVA
jgi:hypothetical protein